MADIQIQSHDLRDGRSILLRSARPADAQATLGLYRAVAAEGPWTMLEPDEIGQTVEQEREAIREELVGDRHLRLVAESEDEVVGTARVRGGGYRCTAHYGQVDLVWVRKDWRGLGVGTSMMNAVIAWAQAHPVLEKLGMFCFSTSTPALALYARVGFVIEGRGPRDMKRKDGSYVDTIFLGRFVD